jgi:hypothetical protein
VRAEIGAFEHWQNGMLCMIMANVTEVKAIRVCWLIGAMIFFVCQVACTKKGKS